MVFNATDFQQYLSNILAVSFIWWRKLEYPEKITDKRKSQQDITEILLKVSGIKHHNPNSPSFLPSINLVFTI
jgi:hypothetical protein